MRRAFHILLVLLCSIQGVLTQSSLAASIAQLPSCALLCLETAVGNSTCSATNTTCVCNDAPLQAQVTLCVTKTCTIKQGLTTKNITENLCGAPVRDKRAQFNALSITFGAVSGAAIVLRVVSKLVTRAEFGLDDYFILATFGSGIPSSVLEVHGLTSNGLGKDIWTLTPQNITDYLQAFYVMEVLYFTQVALLKLSLLFFYLRIFPAPKFRRFLWGTVIFDVAFGAAFAIGGIFQCRPVSYYWTQWDGEHEGSCLNVNAMAWANAIISIVLDVWMLGLAVSQLVKLQMHWKKKVGVGMMFAVATFVTVVSILRLQSLLRFSNSTNLTWDNLAVTQWSTVEINGKLVRFVSSKPTLVKLCQTTTNHSSQSVGIICACMPSMRVLLVRLFPKYLTSTANRSGNKYYGHGSQGHSRLGTNVSVSRAKELPSVPKDQKSIMFSQSYEVDMEDETRLVPMNDLPAGYGKSRSQGSSIEG
ncbi:hypothetical protein D0Z07_5878 [Hyphodiscus hymeniophilus]|uniref:CFEM domain-containing protein n=1 Tax=Hyphodiscus hymeniophilus TaxID=353542 RepID=A0A9P6VHE9_9HELO|nr:hypothetical protein D0Z07_5878 [Hyphodiscus hymeniophilus]